MDDFLQDKPKKNKGSAVVFRGYRRLFALVFAVAVLWQCVSFLQMQLSKYHHALADDFKLVLAVTQNTDNAALTELGDSLSNKEDVLSVKLFSPQDALAALKAKNERLTQAVVALGYEQMPAYFELKLSSRAINNIRPFAQNLQSEYPQLLLKYSPQQAQLAFYSGLCLRTLNLAAVLALVLFFAFMFMVEAYPVRGKAHVGGGVLSALLAGVLSLGLFMLLAYPAGLLVPALQHFTSVERQLGILVFCGLFGWTLSKWQKF